MDAVAIIKEPRSQKELFVPSGTQTKNGITSLIIDSENLVVFRYFIKLSRSLETCLMIH